MAGARGRALHPPRDLTYAPNDLHGFHDAFPQDGRPLPIMVTRNAGGFRGRIGLEAGRTVDTGRWRRHCPGLSSGTSHQ
ncbi:hypothetical protein [Streptomyces sp. enrichment culture]|uniref:hypothetical protein n=1 Tax=Streptomyces sp. enrichment culture TaxID=1795815 RepID=UPI003F55762B